jgi:CheY-like chemotaxis protein/HPt (histidine-containing phosphotransfer) domain-containing protein
VSFPIPHDAHEPGLPTTTEACLTTRGASAVCEPSDDAGTCQARILLVDDYLANRRIAARFLECAGYCVDLAENGQQAVLAFATLRYDLVLMDVEMPLMDGCDATRAIRDVEETRCVQGVAERNPVPIVALTAHAEPKHIERCLESGMNDFIAKPLSPEALLATVGKWTPARRHEFTRSQSRPAAPQTDADLPLDYDRALREFGGDRGLLDEVLGEFLATVARQMTVLGQAIACGDAAAIRHESHAIKGGAANLTARALADAAARLERLGESGNLDAAGDAIARLVAEFARLQEYVQARAAHCAASTGAHHQEPTP